MCAIKHGECHTSDSSGVLHHSCKAMLARERREGGRRRRKRRERRRKRRERKKRGKKRRGKKGERVWVGGGGEEWEEEEKNRRGEKRYRIARKFRGVKFSRFLRICPCPQKF